MSEPEEQTTGDSGEVATSRTAFFEAAVSQLLADNTEFVVVRTDFSIKAEALHVIDHEDRQAVAWKVAALHSADKACGLWLPIKVEQLQGAVFRDNIFQARHSDEHGYRSYRLITKRPHSIDWLEGFNSIGTSGRIYDSDPNNPATDNQLTQQGFENLQKDVDDFSGYTPVLPEVMSTKVLQFLLEVLI